jgi:hypothetical protein
MKAIATSLILLIVLSSCYTETVIGPEGPRGPQGPAGADGENGYVFEWEDVNFTSSNNYEVVLEYPGDFEGFNSDVALVYLLWDAYTTNSGEEVEVWRPLNQTLLTEDGTLMYKYDYSKYDAKIFLEADYSLDLLGAIDTDNWIVRVVVVPGDFWNSGRVDISDYQAVEELLGLPKLNSQHEIKERRK